MSFREKLFHPLIGLALLMTLATAGNILDHPGLSAFGGSEGVGWATTKVVVNASLVVIFLDFLLSGFGYLVLF